MSGPAVLANSGGNTAMCGLPFA